MLISMISSRLVHQELLEDINSNCIKTKAEGARNTFFTNGVVNVWNAISPDSVDFTSLCTFKHTIKLADFSPFLKASMS